MPLPKPKEQEAEDKFMARCIEEMTIMGEGEDNKQRVAVCLTQYRTRKKSKGEASWDDVRKNDALGLI